MWRRWSEPGMTTCYQMYVHNCMLIHGFNKYNNSQMYRTIHIHTVFLWVQQESCPSTLLLLFSLFEHRQWSLLLFSISFKLHQKSAWGRRDQSCPLCLWEALIVKHWFRRLQVWPTAASSATKEAQEVRVLIVTRLCCCPEELLLWNKYLNAEDFLRISKDTTGASQ